MPPRKSTTMKRKNGKKLRGGFFGINISEMIGLKPKDSKNAPELTASSGQSSIVQPPVAPQPDKSTVAPQPVTEQTLNKTSVAQQPTPKPTGLFSGGKKRKTQKKSKTQKKKR
jgi:hypothetical protein